MTRKHFEAIAAIINRYALNKPAPGTFDEGYRDAAYGIANELADQFEKDNARFDRDKFLTACGF